MRVTRIRKAGQRCYSELGASRGAAAFSREKLSVFARGGDTFGGSGQCCFACAGRWVGRVFVDMDDESDMESDPE